jgi:hypothetical protein
MNAFMKFTETEMKESRLSELAKENPVKETDYKQLDKPINMSAAGSKEVSFKGDSDADNYDYYKKAAADHKFWAESHQKSADDRFDLASRNTDNPSKAQSYISEGKNWQSKADSEWKAYQEDLDKANSYKK